MKKISNLLLAFVCASLIYPAGASGQQHNSTIQNKSTEVPMPASKPVIAENYLNTVTTTDTDGTKYKLVIIGDLLPKFYVNGIQINSNNLDGYSDMIVKLTPILWQRQKQASNERKVAVKKTTKPL